ncbi:MAG TPA: DNA polymerase III subunit gamma/tau [Candidatus Cryosericum sp.]|nr:DNA polymerase III subunit gamma/tau [Candidatus Cryosericum sp.]
MSPAESYVSLYRKYRPTTFVDVIGQETIVRILQGSVDHARISHAYLFAGPKGTGKTTVARIFAKALNCSQGPTSRPCMDCEHCKAITAGTDIDVIEIDAASNRRIDEIRDLRESTRFVPARSRYKIFIFDEAHMLTREAFNALLKTLEEPPDYVVFILATTEPQKLPETIISRCQRFDFKRISDVAMLSYLKTIRDTEAPNVTDDALKQIVALSSGSMRGAIGLVDQFSVFGPDPVTAETVLDLLGLPTETMLLLLVEALLSHDVKAAGSVLDDLERSGIEPADLLERSIALISSYILAHVTAGSGDEEVRARLGRFSDGALVDLAESLARLQEQSTYLSDPYPLVQASLLAMALGLATSTTRMREERKVEPVQFVSRDVHRSEPAAVHAESPTGSEAEPEPVAESAAPVSGEDADIQRWDRYKAVVSEASRPIGVMLQALDVRKVGVDQGILRIVLGPKARLFRAALEQKQAEVLAPAAHAVYGVERVVLAEEDSGEESQDKPEPAPPDEKLQLLKKTFDATESLFDP